VEALETMISDVLDIHATFREVKQRTAYKSGLSSKTKSLIKQRDNLNSKMKHLHGDQMLLMHLKYKKARNRCSTLQRSDTTFSGLTNPKDTWRAAKAITALFH
jgi:hypothetical protein